ncbi:MAG: YfhO family protein [Clostridia bacterium]|nr:YfhO family protein [Clostridia bacterium]
MDEERVLKQDEDQLNTDKPAYNADNACFPDPDPIEDAALFSPTSETDDGVSDGSVEPLSGGDPEGDGGRAVKKSKSAVGKFFDDYWLYFAAPLLICGLFFCVLYAYDVFPFSHTTMANYDLLAQICPFLEHFFDVFDGKSSLFYSTAVIGGADVFGTLAYCAVSPFTFLFLVFGKGNAYYAVSFVLPIKLSVVAIAAVYYFKKSFKKVPDHIVLTVAILYAYCGYTFVANTYINWLDFLIYMPFVMLGFKKLVADGKMLYFSVSYALMIYACFSIASFAMFIVFLILVAYAVIVGGGKTTRAELIAKMCLSLAVAVALALPIMVPALKAYMQSGRNTGLFENMDNDLDATHLYAKTSYILSDALFCFLTIAYFIKNGFKKRISVFYLVALIIMMMPVFVDEVCNLLNFGSYMSYALRFGFLSAAFMLHLSGETLDTLDIKKPRNAVAAVITFVVYVALCVAAIVFMILFNNAVTKENLYDFSSKFAHSIGGLEVIAPVFGVIAALLIIAAFFYRFRVTYIKAMIFALIAVFAVQAACYNVHLVKGNTFNPVRYDQFKEIFTSGKYSEAFGSADEEYDLPPAKYFRIKDYDAAISNDAPFTTHTESFSVFSSVIDKKNLAATKFFGYGGNNINSIESKNGLFFGDALLGYKYYFLHNDQKTHSSESRAYNVRLKDTQQSYFAAGLNTLVFPNAYYVKSGDLAFSDDYYDNMSKLYSFLGGEGELFDDYEIENSAITYDVEKKIYTVKIYTKDEGQWYMTYDFPVNTTLKYSLFSNKVEEMKDFSSGEVINFNYHVKAAYSYFYCYIYDGEGVLSTERIIESCKGRCMPLSKIKTVQQLLNTRAADYEISGGDDFKIRVTVGGDDCYLFMNYVAIEGFEASVNGKKTPLIDNGLNFMLVKLDEGENVVEIKYHSPYVKLILLGIVIGAAAAALVLLLVLRWKKLYKKLVPVIAIAGIALSVLVFGFFFAYPTALFAVKLAKLLWGLVF